jgi:hypothetical protein
MAVRRCRHCGEHIEWMLTRYGARLPFNHKPIPVEQDIQGLGWVPGRWKVARQSEVRPALAPLKHYGADKRAAVRRVVLVHSCVGYRDYIKNVVKLGEEQKGKYGGFEVC